MKPRSKSEWILPAALRRLAADGDRPGAGLVLARREEAHEAEQLVRSRDQLLKARLLHPEVG